MTTSIVNPVISVHKVYQTDTEETGHLPLFQTFAELISTFTVPAVGAQVGITVDDSSQYAVGEYVYIPGAGFFEIMSLPSDILIYVLNNGSTGNYDAGVTVPAETPFIVCAPPSYVPTTESLQQSGIVSVITSAANDQKAASVSFSVAFATTPTAVIISVESNANLGAIGGALQLYVRNKSTTGFEIWYSSSVIQTLTVDWIAMM